MVHTRPTSGSVRNEGTDLVHIDAISSPGAKFEPACLAGTELPVLAFSAVHQFIKEDRRPVAYPRADRTHGSLTRDRSGRRLCPPADNNARRMTVRTPRASPLSVPEKKKGRNEKNETNGDKKKRTTICAETVRTRPTRQRPRHYTSFDSPMGARIEGKESQNPCEVPWPAQSGVVRARDCGSPRLKKRLLELPCRARLRRYIPVSVTPIADFRGASENDVL